MKSALSKKAAVPNLYPTSNRTTTITEKKGELKKTKKSEKIISVASPTEKVTRLIKAEYNCSTPVERMLAEQIALAQMKILDHSRLYQYWLSATWRSSSPIKGREIEALSKQIDRAQRQMLAALTALRQIKQPHLQVNVVARNAFVAQNQQINEVQ